MVKKMGVDLPMKTKQIEQITQFLSAYPKEVVELSYVMGEDLASVHKSYRDLIHDRFEYFRQERLQYFNNEWKPKFIRDWTERGRLGDIANGKVVWSKSEKKFVQPSPGKEIEQRIESLQLWGQNAIAQIEQKKKLLLEPVDRDEIELLSSVDNAFNRLYRANAAITAHLNSLRKVQDVQDSILETLKIRDFKTKVDQIIVESSERAKKGLDEIEKADQKVDKMSDALQNP